MDHKLLLESFGDQTLHKIANHACLPETKISHVALHPQHSPGNNMEPDLSMVSANRINDSRTVAWDIVKQITASGGDSQDLIYCIKLSLPSTKSELPANFSKIWDKREHLNVIEDVVKMCDRVALPKSFCQEIVQ